MYVNESTNEIVKKDKKRKGRIGIEKHISNTLICQDGKVSSSRINVMSDDLSSFVSVELNYVGEEDSMTEAGKVLSDAPFGIC